MTELTDVQKQQLLDNDISRFYFPHIQKLKYKDETKKIELIITLVNYNVEIEDLQTVLDTMDVLKMKDILKLLLCEDIEAKDLTTIKDMIQNSNNNNNNNEQEVVKCLTIDQMIDLLNYAPNVNNFDELTNINNCLNENNKMSFESIFILFSDENMKVDYLNTVILILNTNTNTTSKTLNFEQINTLIRNEINVDNFETIQKTLNKLPFRTCLHCARIFENNNNNNDNSLEFETLLALFEVIQNKISNIDIEQFDDETVTNLYNLYKKNEEYVQKLDKYIVAFKNFDFGDIKDIPHLKLQVSLTEILEKYEKNSQSAKTGGTSKTKKSSKKSKNKKKSKHYFFTNSI